LLYDARNEPDAGRAARAARRHSTVRAFGDLTMSRCNSVAQTLDETPPVTNGVPVKRNPPGARGSAVPPPTPNGHIGDKNAPTPAENRFTRPGNPFGRRVAQLRQAAVEAIAPDDVRAIMGKMIELGRAGNTRAAKLVLAYGIGTPVPAPNPDRLDVEEWNHFKETAPMVNELGDLLTPGPSVLLPGLRAAVGARSCEFSEIMGSCLKQPHKKTSEVVRQWLKKKRRRQNAAASAHQAG
jgi:hypothetical protein